MREYRDLESFHNYLDTLTLDARTLHSDGGETIVSDGDTVRVASRQRLHTLPELHLDTDEPLAAPPDLRMLGTLGEGGMGVVHLANQVPLDREVAVKTSRAGADEDAARLLLQEAYVTGYLEHPNILPIYTVGKNRDGAPLIVMKRVEGTSWTSMLAALDDKQRLDALGEHIEILLQVCSAVRFAHSRGILHRDIKPENVMIGHFDEVYLLDWGIALAVDEDKQLLPQLAEASGVAGTPQYMAPEMTFDSPEGLDERADVYLLGATLHHVLTGEPRHKGNRLLEVMYNAYTSQPYEYGEHIPTELAEIANRACRAKREERYESVEAFRDALHDFLKHRDSIDLAQSADVKREELERLLEADEADLAAIHDTYGECRFGFYQALRLWPENALASEGLQRCLEAMTEHYLSQANVEAARACLAELPEPNPRLEARAAELAERSEEDRRDLARLKRLESALDLRTATTSRSRLAIVFGVVWTATSLYAAIRIDQGHFSYAEQLENHMISGFRNLVLVVVGVSLFRKRIFRNAVNRRVIYLLVALFGALAFTRWAVWYVDGNLQVARTSDYMMAAFAIVGAGLLSDMRLCWVALGFASAAVVGMLVPELQVYASTAANAITFGAIAWLWSPSQMDKKTDKRRSD
jgi:serine/threonine-protein kinase